jgi:hypothetical protein
MGYAMSGDNTKIIFEKWSQIESEYSSFCIGDFCTSFLGYQPTRSMILEFAWKKKKQ